MISLDDFGNLHVIHLVRGFALLCFGLFHKISNAHDRLIFGIKLLLRKLTNEAQSFNRRVFYLSGTRSPVYCQALVIARLLEGLLGLTLLLFVILPKFDFWVSHIWQQRNELLEPIAIVEAKHGSGDTVLLCVIARVQSIDIQDMLICSFVEQVVYLFLQLPLHTDRQSSLPLAVCEVYVGSPLYQNSRHFKIGIQHKIQQGRYLVVVFLIQCLRLP